MTKLKNSLSFFVIFSILFTINLSTALAQYTGTYVNVELTTSPAYTTGSIYGNKIETEVGNSIGFVRNITSDGPVNYGWTWNFDKSILDCSGFPDFDSNTLMCDVLKPGNTQVSITLRPENITQKVVTSNIFYVEVKDPNPYTGTYVDVELTTSPAYTTGSIHGNKIETEVGNSIGFVRNVTSDGPVNYGWTWNFDKSILDCSGFPDFDSKTLMCDVLKPGDTQVSITLHPENITQKVVTSNIFYVDIDAPQPVTYTLPPAGYEDEVLTNIQDYKNPFPDTSLSNTEGKAAAELYRRGIIGGFPDGQFKGDRPVNRAEAAKFLMLSIYADVSDEFKNHGTFWDVMDGQWYTKFVMAAHQANIISGHPDGSFKPADSVNTAEFLKMITQTFSLQTNLNHSYYDVKSTDWYSPFVGAAQAYNLLPTRNSSYFEAGRHMTRNEVAVAIYQYLQSR